MKGCNARLYILQDDNRSLNVKSLRSWDLGNGGSTIHDETNSCEYQTIGSARMLIEISDKGEQHIYATRFAHQVSLQNIRTVSISRSRRQT